MPDLRPLVLTVSFAPDDQARFDALRREHFPPERNHLQAHLTLFHALPGDGIERVGERVAEACRRDAFDVAVGGLVLLGRGVALGLRSAELTSLHRALARQLGDDHGDRLTRQDQQGLRPHVTVANKLDPRRARELHADLAAAFTPWTARATGLALWRYDGGPWEHALSEAFTGPGQPPA